MNISLFFWKRLSVCDLICQFSSFPQLSLDLCKQCVSTSQLFSSALLYIHQVPLTYVDVGQNIDREFLAHFGLCKYFPMFYISCQRNTMKTLLPTNSSLFPIYDFSQSYVYLILSHRVHRGRGVFRALLGRRAGG